MTPIYCWIAFILFHFVVLLLAVGTRLREHSYQKLLLAGLALLLLLSLLVAGRWFGF